MKERQQVAAYEFAMKHNIFRTAHAGEAVGPSSIQNVSKSFNSHAVGLVRRALLEILSFHNLSEVGTGLVRLGFF